MSLRLTSLALLAAPVLGLMAACQAPPPRVSTGTAAGRGDAAAAAYCRQRAEEVYSTQNRSARIQSDNRDSPFSGSYVPSVTSRGLSDRYAMDGMIADCLRNTANRDVGNRDVGNRDVGPESGNVPASPPVVAPRAASPSDLRPAAASGAQVPVERAPPPPRP